MQRSFEAASENPLSWVVAYKKCHRLTKRAYSLAGRLARKAALRARGSTA